MESFLRRKKIYRSWKTYFIDAMGAMAFGLFASLLVGTILNTIGQQFNIAFLTEELWPVAQQATGAAIAVAIAHSLKAPPLVLFSWTVVGFAGNKLVGPMGIFFATIIAWELGRLVQKERKMGRVMTRVVPGLR